MQGIGRSRGGLSTKVHVVVDALGLPLTFAIERSFVDALSAMSWENPKHRPVLEADGLRKWLVADTSGYDSLREAARAQGFFAPNKS